MGGIFGALSTNANPDVDQRTRALHSPASTPDRPATLNDLAERAIGKTLTGRDAQAAREALEKLNRSGLPTNIDARIVRALVFAVVGGIIGAALPGHLGLPGMFIGLFLGLRGWKKK